MHAKPKISHTEVPSMNTRHYQLTEIVTALSKHHQRATYKAVAGLVGLPARSVMSGKPKTIDNSWIVEKRSGMPSGYLPTQTHHELKSTSTVISTPEDLATWLRAKTGP
jgi:hypothetical protein